MTALKAINYILSKPHMAKNWLIKFTTSSPQWACTRALSTNIFSTTELQVTESRRVKTKSFPNPRSSYLAELSTSINKRATLLASKEVIKAPSTTRSPSACKLLSMRSIMIYLILSNSRMKRVRVRAKSERHSCLSLETKAYSVRKK